MVAVLCEGVRLNLIEVCMKSSGFKLNSLSALQIFAPLTLVMLVPFVFILDRGALMQREAGFGELLTDALFASALDVSAYFVVVHTSGLVLALGGVFKDIVILAIYALLLGIPVPTMQMVGYGIALSGVQAYLVVSSAPEEFESMGVLVGIWHKLLAFSSEMSPSKDQKSKAINNQLDIELDGMLVDSSPSTIGKPIVGSPKEGVALPSASADGSPSAGVSAVSADLGY
eukprot:gnl/TRDRNA2_/TRDRNA2_129279_c1_seq2.p1 gnl/TRDRNA2_/TRDRNA2_129279_c1~~gnl/TRDRNA2_/TRDRNA2_129279_c1_seq2.p1  ORF type:complete len:245 (-),score=40.75 gnl/TRDRNA2_/TRDRNA2_129279_c1_seq2:102-788(-)